MNKLTRFLSICVFSLTVSVILFSCCRGEILITGGGELTTDFNIDPSEVINEPFNLVNNFESEIVYEEASNFSLINSALATTCDYDFRNEIDMAALRLTVDQNIELEDLTIQAGTNLLALDQFSPAIESGFAALYITIDAQFFEDATFEKSEHTFLLTANMDDGLTTQTSLTLDFDF
jgi:hypothetical protein